MVAIFCMNPDLAQVDFLAMQKTFKAYLVQASHSLTKIIITKGQAKSGPRQTNCESCLPKEHQLEFRALILLFLLTLTMIFQLAECEELAKNESELTFKLKKAELVVQQVCEFFVFQYFCIFIVTKNVLISFLCSLAISTLCTYTVCRCWSGLQPLANHKTSPVSSKRPLVPSVLVTNSSSLVA